MKISTVAITNGKILDKYGKRGTQFSKNGIPNLSIPLVISEAPKEAVCFALYMEDIDAIPVCGYSWIHWVAANIAKTGDTTEITENASQLIIQGNFENTDSSFVQGVNSWCGKIVQLDATESIGYGGMAPPDQPHSYDLYVYALDKELDLTNGFYANELIHKMKNHIVATAKITGIYDN